MCWSIDCLLETVKAEWMSYIVLYGVMLVVNHVSVYYDKSKSYGFFRWCVIIVGAFVVITISRNVIISLKG